jgi:hypothetical protein
MNLAAMIAMVRKDLHDEDSGNYRWTDAELTRHIGRAVGEVSEGLPLLCRAALPTASGSRELDISGLTGRVMVEAVEYPVGDSPPSYQQFSIWGDTLTIVSGGEPDGANAYIYYGRLHTLDAGGSTLPVPFEDLVAGGASGYAAVAWAGYAVNRVNTGGTGTAGELLEWGNRQLEQFRRELRRLGRRHRVRASALYRPGCPGVSKDTDYGP